MNKKYHLCNYSVKKYVQKVLCVVQLIMVKDEACQHNHNVATTENY